MNRLVRNLAKCVKNNHKTRTLASYAQTNSIAKCKSVGLVMKCSANLIFSEKNKYCTPFKTQLIAFSSDARNLSQLDYENFCAESLDSLCDYIEELVESVNHLSAADVVNKDGVLTVSLGPTYGTYVINKQSPNKQIWLSSPTSGPKRFDFAYASNGSKTGYWVYKHTGETLHELLDNEFSKIAKVETKFQTLSFGSSKAGEIPLNVRLLLNANTESNPAT